MSILISSAVGSATTTVSDPESKFFGRIRYGLNHYPPLNNPDFASVVPLTSADFAFCGVGPGDAPIMIGGEVCSITDLTNKLLTGRLQSSHHDSGQLAVMAQTYTYSWLVYYGEHRPCPQTGVLQTLRLRKGQPPEWVNYLQGTRPIPYSYIYRFLASPSFLSLGCRVARFHDLSEVAYWVGNALYPEWNKPWHKHGSLNVVNKSSSVNEFLPQMDERQYGRLKTASTFPCMGYTRALAASLHFQSIREMVNASAEEWRRIEGIGKTVSKAVVDYVG